VLSHYFSLADLTVCLLRFRDKFKKYKLLIFALWGIFVGIRKTVSKMSQLPGIGKEQQRACFTKTANRQTSITQALTKNARRNKILPILSHHFRSHHLLKFVPIKTVKLFALLKTFAT
jgi:uncharacterized protein YneF (UPF0154 family)